MINRTISIAVVVLVLVLLAIDATTAWKESYKPEFRTTMSLSNATVRTSQVVGSSVNETDRKAER
jgi:hypothetical protein